MYIDDVLSINNPEFENHLGEMFPAELEIKATTDSTTSASYLDLLLSIWRDGQLHTSIYDKRDDFNFHITKFPSLSSNIPSSPAYGVFISQLIRYDPACSSYECFILRAMRLSSKLLNQGCLVEHLASSFRKFYGRYADLIQQYEVTFSRMLNDILTLTNSDFPNDQTFHQFHDLYSELYFHRILSGFHGTFATGEASKEGTLTLPDTWCRPPPFRDLLVLQLLRPDSSNLPCLYSTFHLEYPLVLSRFCLTWPVRCLMLLQLPVLSPPVIFVDNASVLTIKTRLALRANILLSMLIIYQKYVLLRNFSLADLSDDKNLK